MKRLLLLATGYILLIMPPVAAHASTILRLDITPKLCVVDVVQDGSNQTLQTPSPGCEAALPNLVPAIAGPLARSPFVALPFAGATQQVPLLQSKAEDAWSPIVSKEQGGPSTFSSTRSARVATGLAVSAIASAIGIDLALFELHYSRAIMRLVRRWSFGQVKR